MGEAEDLDNTAKARKRRMQRRAKQQSDDAAVPSNTKKPRLEEDSASSSDEESPTPPGTLSKDDLAKIPGVKKQARYVPAVPMTKAELTLWRKEARRVRNRESAAASRQKTQKRITELETEVGELTTKYQAALKRIVELEAAAAAHSDAWKAPKMMTTAQHVVVAASPVLEPHTVSPPLSPRESFSLDESSEPVMMMTSQSRSAPSYPHHPATTTCKISRPNAVKIPTPVAGVDVDDRTALPPLGGSSHSQGSYSPAAPQDMPIPDAALATAAEAAANDYPLAALDDTELGDFLNFAMSVEGESAVHPDRHTDALCIFEELSPPSVLMAPP